MPRDPSSAFPKEEQAEKVESIIAKAKTAGS